MEHARQMPLLGDEARQIIPATESAAKAYCESFADNVNSRGPGGLGIRCFSRDFRGSGASVVGRSMRRRGSGVRLGGRVRGGRNGQSTRAAFPDVDLAAENPSEAAEFVRSIEIAGGFVPLC